MVHAFFTSLLARGKREFLPNLESKYSLRVWTGYYNSFSTVMGRLRTRTPVA